jgi:hypothetical protein
MSLFSFFSPVRVPATGSSTSLSELDHVAALKEALDGLDTLLDDDIKGTILDILIYFRC